MDIWVGAHASECCIGVEHWCQLCAIAYTLIVATSIPGPFGTRYPLFGPICYRASALSGYTEPRFL